MKYKTPWTNEADIKRNWYVVDMEGKILGRAATKIAGLLIGKDKINQVPNLDNGDYVIVVNASKLSVTNRKELEKFYYSYSGYPSGLKVTRMDEMMKKNPSKIIELAVKNMLPNNKLRDRVMTRLFVYADANHEQVAQQPVEVKL